MKEVEEQVATRKYSGKPPMAAVEGSNPGKSDATLLGNILEQEFL